MQFLKLTDSYLDIFILINNNQYNFLILLSIIQNYLLFSVHTINQYFIIYFIISMLSYHNLAQSDYQKEKDIPVTNPLHKPKQNSLNILTSPVPHPFNTLLPSNL